MFIDIWQICNWWKHWEVTETTALQRMCYHLALIAAITRHFLCPTEPQEIRLPTEDGIWINGNLCSLEKRKLLLYAACNLCNISWTTHLRTVSWLEHVRIFSLRTSICQPRVVAKIKLVFTTSTIGTEHNEYVRRSSYYYHIVLLELAAYPWFRMCDWTSGPSISRFPSLSTNLV